MARGTQRRGVGPARGRGLPDTRKKAPARRRGRGPGRGAGLGVVGAVVVVCAALSVLATLDHLSNAGEIRRGVHVGDVGLGGKTPEEARSILARSNPQDAEIRLLKPRQDAAVPAASLGVRLDVEATVGRAYAVGREGGVLGRLADRARAPFGVGAPAEVRYSTEDAEAWVRGVAERDAAAVREASAEISGTDVSVTPSRPGYALDVPATLRRLDGALKALRTGAPAAGEVERPAVTTREAETAALAARGAMEAPIRLTTGEETYSVPRAAVASSLDMVRRDGSLEVAVDREALGAHMARALAPLFVEPVEAGYEIEGEAVAVTPGREGRRVEEEKLLDAVSVGLFRGVREYEVPVAVDRPGLSTAEAERLKPTGVLGSYRTDYSVVPDDGTRVENLGISSEAVSGTLLAPGETFSMLEHVAGLPYNDSKVIVGGVEVDADGGGLCQVTSTLYNAANFAGLDVTERSPHSAQLPYIRPGLDATVWWGSPGKRDDLDMKFRNTTGGYLLLREYVADDGYVYAEIWGRPDGTEVEMYSEPTYMGADGSEWVTRQKITRGGEVTYDGVLHKDTYELLVEGKNGKPIPPSDVPVAPVNP